MVVSYKQYNLRQNYDNKECKQQEFMSKKGNAALSEDENGFEIYVSLAVTIWLMVITCVLSRILRTETEDWTLTKDNSRLLTMVWGFILIYSSWIVEDLILIVAGYQSIFEMSLLWMLTPFVCNFVPISIVLYIHFRNVQSLVKVINKWVKSIPRPNKPVARESTINTSYQVTV